VATITYTNGYTFVSGDINYTTKLVAIASGDVWYESVSGTMVALSAANNTLVASNANISATPAYSKVFIVDGTSKYVVDFTNTMLTVPAMTTAPTRGSTLTQATSGATMIVDFVNTAKTAIYGFLTAGTFTATYAVTGGGMTSSTPSVVTAPTTPHYYAWTVYPTIGSTTYGTIPELPNLMCMYLGRLVLNNLKNPNVWYMSRQANPYDWLYGVNDQQSAVAGTDNVLGFIGDIPTCFIPYSDDYMIVGCAHKIEVFRGDPCKGGSLDTFYTADGIFGPKSFCFDGYGTLYFAGTAGIYKLARDSTIPEPLTNTRIPKILDGIDRDTHRITMGFDRQRHGITISILNIALDTSVNYWYDLRTDGIFPETYNVGISAQEFYDSNTAAYSKLVIGSTDGYLRYFKDDSYSDQSAGDINVAIDSHVVYGPLVIAEGSSVKESILNNTSIVLGASSTKVNYDIYVNNSAEALVDDLSNAGLANGTFTSGGRQNDIRSRARGKVMAIKIGNSTAEKTFAVERIDIDVITQ